MGGGLFNHLIYNLKTIKEIVIYVGKNQRIKLLLLLDAPH